MCFAFLEREKKKGAHILLFKSCHTNFWGKNLDGGKRVCYNFKLRGNLSADFAMRARQEE